MTRGTRPAVAELRRRKHRDEKPFAVMVADAAAAAEPGGSRAGGARLAACRRVARSFCCESARPSAVAEAVAPGNPSLGVMLPYTPLHHLLMRAVDGVPLVMTSGNRSDEPIAYRDDDRSRKLAGIADLFLIAQPAHPGALRRLGDARRATESSCRCGGRAGTLRCRSTLPFDVPAADPGGGRATQGDLCPEPRTPGVPQPSHGRPRSLRRLPGVREGCRSCTSSSSPFSPNVSSTTCTQTTLTTRYADDRRCTRGHSGFSPIQHHHAHMASCMAEHGLIQPVIGVAFDGTGLRHGWGGLGRRIPGGRLQELSPGGPLRYVGMPGGDRAIREPWRMALAHLADAEAEDAPFVARFSRAEVAVLRKMIARRLGTPRTSSAGRLFDAVASLAGVRDRVSYEGQAAVELEWLASEALPEGVYPFALSPPRDEEPQQTPLVVDTRPLIRAVAEDVAGGALATSIARRFHSTIVNIIAAVCSRLRMTSGIDVVVLSGGVFMNVLLTCEVVTRLESDGFRVYRHRRVPPNDGGLSLGQLAIAAAYAP